MIDNFNNMLMPFNVDSKLSGVKEQAANFAALEQSSIKSGRLADVMAGNSSQIQFNQIFNDELKSLAREQTIKPSSLAGADEISEAELKQMVRTLREQLIDAKSGDSADKLTLQEVTDKLTNLLNTVTAADAEMATDEAQQLTDKISQWFKSSEQLSEPLSGLTQQELSKEGLSQEELSPKALSQLLAAKIERATPQQLDDLARLTGLDNDELAALAEQLTTRSDISKEQEGELATDAQPMADLLGKLEQLIEALPNSRQLAAELDNLKQALAQQQAPTDSVDIEQIIERRVNQPISELINQLQSLMAGADGTELKNQVDSSGNSNGESRIDGDSEQIKQQIKNLIEKLPIKEQQQLLATMKAEQQQKNNELALESGAKLVNESQSSLAARPTISSSSAGAISLADMPAAAIVSSQVSEKTTKEAAIKSIDGQYGETTEENAVDDTIELSVNPKNGDSFDNLLKQIAARPPAAGQNTPLQQTELAAAIASELGKAESSTIATKDLASVTKSATEQLLAKLPLDQDTQAARALKERMSLMVKGDVQHAVIQLDPEELGGMSIRVQIQNDQMSVQFQVQNAQAKEMLENAMVKLKEMLDQQGIVLKDSDVQHQDKSEQQQSAGNESGGNQDDLDSDQDAVVLTLHKQSANGIDYYA